MESDEFARSPLIVNSTESVLKDEGAVGVEFPKRNRTDGVMLHLLRGQPETRNYESERGRRCSLEANRVRPFFFGEGLFGQAGTLAEFERLLPIRRPCL